MNNQTALLGFHPGTGWLYRLTGTTKMLALAILTLIGMVSYDTRYLILLTGLSVIVYWSAHIAWRDVKVLMLAIFFFTLLNLVLVFIFGPHYGEQIYGSRHVIIGGNAFFALTQEEVFYLFNMTLKYLFAIPLVFVFLFTTNPSEFAASLNKIGLSYKVSYSVAIALRYIPDIQVAFHQISLAQQARGLESSKKAGLMTRLRSASHILIPLVFNSLDQIESVSRAMRLRRFGSKKKRTWYMAKPMTTNDWLIIATVILLTLLGLWLFKVNGSRFYNPFN